MLFIIIVGIWFLCGLLAVYITIKSDTEECKKEIQDHVIEFIGLCILLFVLGCISLILVCLVRLDDNPQFKNFLINIIDKIGGTKK